MLELVRQVEREQERAALRARTNRHRFAFGGVAFEVLADEGVRWDLPRSVTRLQRDTANMPVVADVVCSIAVDRTRGAIPPTAPQPRLWQTSAHGTRIELPDVRIDLLASGPKRYAAAVRVVPTKDALGTALIAVAGGIVQAEAGLTLHATAVEHDGGAVLLLGPSGAGKTTAAGLIESASCIAHDRVALLPNGEGFNVWALPGGCPPLLPQSEHVVLPLHAVLRVKHELPETTLIRASGAEALFILREALMGEGAPQLEARWLDTMERISAALPVGIVHTVLGQHLDAELRTFVSSHQRHPSGAAAGAHFA
jgi:hypothetical protein